MSLTVFKSLFFQLFLAALAYAAPIADETLSAKAVDNTWTYGTGGGIIGFIVLVLDIIAFSAYTPPLLRLLFLWAIH